jgi:PIN domain nuclease of toxin-antitoxin system
LRLLLDTCAFIWAGQNSPELSAAARGALLDPESELLLSVVSSWEIALKTANGKIVLTEPVDLWVPRIRSLLGVASLAIEEEAALQVGKLPLHHRDPFDRMLVAQAIVHGCVLVTPDRAIAAYPVRTLW